MSPPSSIIIASRKMSKLWGSWLRLSKVTRPWTSPSYSVDSKEGLTRGSGAWIRTLPKEAAWRNGTGLRRMLWLFHLSQTAKKKLWATSFHKMISIWALFRIVTSRTGSKHRRPEVRILSKCQYISESQSLQRHLKMGRVGAWSQNSVNTVSYTHLTLPTT